MVFKFLYLVVNKIILVKSIKSKLLVKKIGCIGDFSGRVLSFVFVVFSEIGNNILWKLGLYCKELLR